MRGEEITKDLLRIRALPKIVAFHKSHRDKYIRDGVVIVAIAVIAVMIFKVNAATYTFVQTSWSGGATSNNANHTSNRTGWNQYSSKDATIAIVNGGANVQLAPTASSSAQTTDTDFNAGTYSSTAVTGSGASGSVSLATTSMATFSTGASTNPTDVIFDPSTNSMWVSLDTTGRVLKMNPSTGATIGTYFGGSNPQALAFSSSTNSIWSAAYGDSQLREIRASDGTTLHMYNTSQFTRIAYDTSTNSIWGIREGYSNLAYKINASTGATTGSYAVSTNGTYDYNVVFDSSTNSIWVLNNVGSFYKIKAADGTNVGFSVTNLNWNKPIVFDSSTNSIWVVTNTNGSATSTIKKFKALDGSLLGTYVDSRHHSAAALTFDTVTNSVWEANGSNVYKINASGTIVGTFNTGGSNPKGMAFDPVTNSVWVAYYASNAVTRVPVTNIYASSGTFTSSVINLGSPALLSTLAYAATLNGQTLTVDVRAGNTPTPDGSWSAWQTNIASGGDISSLSGNQYVQYRANLSTSNTTVTPTLDSVTINYSSYSPSGTLTSSVYDTSSSGNLVSNIAWTSTGTSGTETVKFQIRSSPDNVTWSAWCGMADSGTTCTGSNYFTSADSGVAMASTNPLRSGNNDQYFQYKVFLGSGGLATPTLTGVTVTYVVNAPPQFDTSFGTQGAIASQVSTSTDPNWGKVHIQYKVEDPDTTTGTITPGYVTPSFEYNIGNGWVAIATSSLSAGDTSNKAVQEGSYTLYDAYLDVKSLFPNSYIPSMQIRVKVDDNEAANNIAYAITPAFAVDAKAPTISSFHIDGTSATGTVSFSGTDETALNYVLSNSSALTADGLNSTSGVVQSVGSNNATVAIPWNLIASSTKVVYLSLIDTYGNTTSSSVTVPGSPSNIEYKDVSNVAGGMFREFIAWNLYPSPAPAGAAFGSYKVYASTDATNFSLLTTITNPDINYFIDTPVSTSTVYYYKILFVTANGDRSSFSPTVSDIPDGKGGSINGAIPMISNVQISNVKNTSAQITWDTDDLSLSEVDYGTSNSYGQVVTSRSYVTSHSVYLSGLTPNTSYYFRVRSIDVTSGAATNDNGGNGYTFTTTNGTVITNVNVPAISDTGADISWITSTSSTSYVDYSTNPTLLSYAEAGSSDFVDSPFQHKVSLSGLSPNTTYYFQVTSTDHDGNTTVDSNNNSYYTFKTTYDTKAPVITDVQVPVRASNAAVITWKTDELSSSQVFYGTDSVPSIDQYAKESVEQTTPTIFHSVTLSEQTERMGGGTNKLNNKTSYYFRALSKDQAGNSTSSAEYTFTTTEDGAVYMSSGGSVYTGTGSSTQDMTPPVISNILISSINPFGATVSFSTDKPTRAIVRYGKSTDYSGNTADADLSVSHSITLKGLSMATLYHISASVIDKNGNVASSPDQTFTTQSIAENLGNLLKVDDAAEMVQKKVEDIIESALPSINPPYLSDPSVGDIGEDHATISWNTNIKAYGSVVYAEDTSFAKDGKYTSEISQTDNKTTSHTVTLENLTPGMKYHFKAKSYVFLGAAGQTDDLTFTTKVPSVSVQVVDRKKDSMRVVWTSNIPTTSVVSYKKKGSTMTLRQSSDSLTTSHDVSLGNLTPGSVYELNVFGLDADGNVVGIDNPIMVSTNEDITAPIISNFKVDSALLPGRTDRTQTIVSWKTDEPSTSAVYYEEGSGSASSTLSGKKEDTSLLTDTHIMILTNLKPGSIYRIQIASTDDANNTAKTPVRTIVTPSQSESVVDVIFKNFDDTFKFMKSIH